MEKVYKKLHVRTERFSNENLKHIRHILKEKAIFKLYRAWWIVTRTPLK